MRLNELQQKLKDTGRYTGAVDGAWGRLTEAAILTALTDGPDTKLTEQDFKDSAARLGVPVAAIKAVIAVESSGAGFFNGRPLILPEPHRFSKATGGRFNAKYPLVSYTKWGARPYDKSQDARYTKLLKMISLDVDAGFASASYGKFQIMGENYRLAGYGSSFDFAVAQARDEKTQLLAFEAFLRSTGLIKHLKALDWASFARGYNGTGYLKNNYHIKLANAYRSFS